MCVPGLFESCPPAGYVCVWERGGVVRRHAVAKLLCAAVCVVVGDQSEDCALMLHECVCACASGVCCAGMVQLAQPSGQALCEQQQTPRQPLRGPLHALQPCHLSCWVMWLPLLLLAWLSGCAACLAPWGVPRCVTQPSVSHSSTNNKQLV